MVGEKIIIVVASREVGLRTDRSGMRELSGTRVLFSIFIGVWFTQTYAYVKTQ